MVTPARRPPGSGSAPAPGTTPGSTATSAGAPTTGSAPASSGSTAAAASALGKKALAALLITRADLPAGWTASRDDSTDDTDAADHAKFAKCVGIRDTYADQVAEADSDDFSYQSATVSASATSYSSADDVRNDIQGFQDATKASTCMASTLRADMAGQLPHGAKIDDISFTVHPGTNGGPSNVIAKINGSVTVTTSGQRVPVYVDSVYITGRQIEAEIDFEGIGQPVDAALQTKLIKTLAERVGAA